MAINFPDTPILDEEFTSGDTTWKWDGQKWNIVPAIIVGPPGSKGDTGVGLKGDKGDAAATVAVGTTTTGAAGTSAQVTNEGTSSDAVFAFVIPRGNTGDKGDKGDTGNVGPQGITGAGSLLYYNNYYV